MGVQRLNALRSVLKIPVIGPDARRTSPHGFLTENLPVPVINPGPLSYAIAQMLLVTGLSQSKTFYHTPEVPKLGMTAAMLAAAQSFEADAG